MAKFDLHIHSNYSDGSDSIKTLLDKILNAGIKIFALTDHDTVAGCGEMKNLLPKGIDFIEGTELTCKTDNLSCHILGFNVDCTNPILLSLIEKGKQLRKQKLDTRVNYLKEVHKIDLTSEETEWLYSRNSVVKTHLANILVNRGLAKDNIEAMRKYLDDCKTGNTKFSIKEAIHAIKSAGGIPVWAHPLGGEGETHDTKEIFLSKLETMKKYGIEGLECYYSRYNDSESNFLANCAKRNNLLISGGSDYHGTNKNIPLGRLNSVGKYIDSAQISVLNPLLHSKI